MLQYKWIAGKRRVRKCSPARDYQLTHCKDVAQGSHIKIQSVLPTTITHGGIVVSTWLLGRGGCVTDLASHMCCGYTVGCQASQVANAPSWREREMQQGWGVPLFARVKVGSEGWCEDSKKKPHGRLSWVLNVVLRPIPVNGLSLFKVMEIGSTSTNHETVHILFVSLHLRSARNAIQTARGLVCAVPLGASHSWHRALHPIPQTPLTTYPGLWHHGGANLWWDAHQHLRANPTTIKLVPCSASRGWMISRSSNRWSQHRNCQFTKLLRGLKTTHLT